LDHSIYGNRFIRLDDFKNREIRAMPNHLF
jgi:hypothetical protein